MYAGRAHMHCIGNILFSLWTYRIVRWSLGTVFVISGVLKLMDVEGFARTIAQFNLAPPGTANFAAYLLPIVELAAGFGLVMDLKGSLALICGMLVFFMGVLWFGIVQDLNVDCGCFSKAVLAQKNSLAHGFYRDIIFLIMGGYLYAWRRIRKKIE